MRTRSGIALALGASLVVLVSVAARTASGHSNGVTGSSGKSASSCNSCHQGGQTPKVTLEGPTQLEAGVPVTYTFRIDTPAPITGMNAAATDDVVLVGDGDGGTTLAEGAEITHARTLAPVDGGALYTFTLTAPYGETITLYAAGNAANGNGQSDGDTAATTTLVIAVDGPPRPPPPPPPAPTPPAPPPAAPVADASAEAGASEAEPTTDSGCALVPSSSDVGSAAGAGGLVALLCAARLARSSRRRRR